MFQKEGLRHFSAIIIVVMLVATQLIGLGTAVLADTNNNVQNDLVKVEQAIIEEKIFYQDSKLQEVAAQYDVEIEYLFYIAEVEKLFGLQPYELFAIIAQESEFKPKTHIDGGSFSYSTTQMKLPTAKTAYMAITEYYNMSIPYPTHELLSEDKYYATLLAGGYIKYLHDTYQNEHESYTAYRWGINGRKSYFQKNGDYQSPYALKVSYLQEKFIKE